MDRVSSGRCWLYWHPSHTASYNREYSFQLKRWQVDGDGKSPVLNARVNVDWLTLDTRITSERNSNLNGLSSRRGYKPGMLQILAGTSYMNVYFSTGMAISNLSGKRYDLDEAKAQWKKSRLVVWVNHIACICAYNTSFRTFNLVQRSVVSVLQ